MPALPSLSAAALVRKNDVVGGEGSVDANRSRFRTMPHCVPEDVFERADQRAAPATNHGAGLRQGGYGYPARVSVFELDILDDLADQVAQVHGFAARRQVALEAGVTQYLADQYRLM